MIALRRSRVLPIGLQLGPRSATLAQVADRAGAVEVATLAHADLPTGDDRPVDEQDRAVAQALKKLVADHRFHGRSVVSCLASQDLFVQNMRLPQLPPEEVERVIQHEADERLPYPAEEAEVRHLLAGQVRQDGQIRQEVILLASQRAAVQRHIQLLEAAGLVPAAIDVEACAVLRALHKRPSEGTSKDRRGYLILGDDATTVIFAEGGRILFLKQVSGGGQQLDEAVARHLSLSEAEARRIRSSVTAAPELDSDDEIHRSVADAIRGPLEAVASEIELCLRYYMVTFRGKALDRVVVTGSESSQWLAEYLCERLGAPCALGNPYESCARRPSLAPTPDQPWRWTTAIGLSLKGWSNPA